MWIARAEHRADPSCTGLQMASGRPHWNPDRVIIIPWFRSLNRGYHSTIFNVVITLHRPPPPQPPCCHSGVQRLSKVAQFIFFDIWNNSYGLRWYFVYKIVLTYHEKCKSLKYLELLSMRQSKLVHKWSFLELGY